MYREFVSTMPAENRLFTKLGVGPNGRFVIGHGIVTRVARIVGIATRELDGNNVFFRRIVRTLGVRLDANTAHNDAVDEGFMSVFHLNLTLSAWAHQPRKMNADCIASLTLYLMLYRDRTVYRLSESHTNRNSPYLHASITLIQSPCYTKCLGLVE